MLNKEILKEYVVRGCDKLAYVMSKKEYAFSLLKKIIESKILLNDDPEAGDDAEHDIDSLLDYIKLNPEAYELLQNRLQNQEKDSAQLLIEEMKNFQEVSELSRRYFALLYPGVCARADTHDLSLDGQEIRNLSQVEENTQKLLLDPRIKVIFEGQVSCEGLLARWDVLIKEKAGYVLYEVKGSNNVYNRTAEKDSIIPNKIKKPFLYDIAFQYEVYKCAKLPIIETNFLFLNKNFMSQKNHLSYPLEDRDVLLLFQEAKEVFDSNKKDKNLIPIQTYIDRLLYMGKEDYSVPAYINQLKNIEAKQALPPTKLLYACRKAGGCLLKDECYPDLKEDPDHIFKLTCYNRIGGSYRTCTRLIEAGIDHIDQIPDHIVADDYPATKQDKRLIANMQIEYAKGNLQGDWIDKEGIKALLKQDYTQFPLIFFDFETFSYPIPIVENCRPWERVCCQYSMHVVEEGYNVLQHDFAQGSGGGIQHYEFIGNPKNDKLTNPELALIQTLQAQLQAARVDVDNGKFTLVVYNKSFEKGELTRMALKYPDYALFLTKLNVRVVDLLDFFTQGYWYQENFHGKVSLKVTQPELVKSQHAHAVYKEAMGAIHKTLDYKQGIIQNGGIALDVYQSLLRKVLLHQDVEEMHDPLIAALLAYCKIDSWGTVVLYDIIKQVAMKREE